MAVTNSGIIQFQDKNDVTAVLVQGGNTASVTNNATLQVDDTSQATTDSNGILHGARSPTARAASQSTWSVRGSVNGSITNSASGVITIKGDNSAGILLETGLTGSLISQGGITVQGTNAIGIHATQPGDHRRRNLTLAGTINAAGLNAQGVSVSDVAGAR